MRIVPLLVFALTGCSGAEPVAEAPLDTAAPSRMSGYATTPHVRAYPASVTEGDAGDPLVMVRITLSPRVARPVHVDFLTADSSAREGQDYRRAKGRVTFDPGKTEETIGIRIIGDEIAEKEESFLLRLHVAEYGVLDTESVTVTIFDDD
jgi:hypothetical protein